MSTILSRIRDVDPNDSEAIKEALSTFFQNLLKYNEVECTRWLRALKDVINRFPKFCGTHRPTIETYLTHFLKSHNFYNVIEAAKCAHAVQQVRPAQEKTATAKFCWREQMAVLCDAAHKLVDALFVKNTSSYGNQKKQKIQQVSPSSTLQEALLQIDTLTGKDQAISKTDDLCTRLRNVLVFIQAMLVEIYPVAKPVQPQLVLQVILQALSAPGSEDSSTVTTIKIQALRTLDALVACLGSNLIPFSALIFRFVMQTLKWSSDNPSEESRKVRVQAYSSLSQWLGTLRVHRPSLESRARAWHVDLSEHVCADVTPVKHTVQLTVNASHSMKNLSKKARKRLANTMLKESSIASHMPGEKNKHNLSEKSNDEIAIAALACAETFLNVCGIFLNNTTHKQFQELLVRECFSINDYSTERAMCLLQALEASRKNCSNKVPPPTQYCLQLYSVLINSPMREISKFCSAALLDIRLHLHCSPASLNFSLEQLQQSTKKNKEDGRKKVSEKNRAALEKLLGADWSSESPTDVVITIPDEPSSKRPRVDSDNDNDGDEEISENVSISSDSIHSVEENSDTNDSIIEAIDVSQESESFVNEKDRNALSLIVAEIHKEPTQSADNADDTETNNSNPVSSIEQLTQVKDHTIHNQITQAPVIDIVDEDETDKGNDDVEVGKIMETPSSANDINEAKTQLLQNSDPVDGKSPVSMEVAYDFPNTGEENVKVLDKMDDENLPSTNDTDDIQITCGQVVKNSQDLETEKKDGENENSPNGDVVPKVNGIKNVDAMNGDTAVVEEVTSKPVLNGKAFTVEDMLADFVDEVNEETQA